MASTPRRAVYLIPIGEQPPVAQIGQEQVNAYRTVQQMTVLTRTVNVYQPRPRNARNEAAARVFAAQNFR